MNKNLKIAVIIVNWKKYHITKKCINSVLNSSFTNFKIILIDNESNKKELNKILNEKVIFFSLTKNNGFAKAVNIGIKYSIENNYDYIFLLNNDTTIDNFCLENLLDFSKRKSISIVQPLIFYMNNKSLIWNYGGRINYFFGVFKTLNKRKKISQLKNIKEDSDWFTGCACLIKSSVFKKVGFFDEDFFAYFEDVDFSLRLKELNFKIGLDINSYLFHHESFSLKSGQNKEGKLNPYAHYLNIKNHIILLKKHIKKFNFFGIILFQFFKIISYSIYFLIRFRFNKLRMVYKGLFNAFKFD